MLDVAKAAVSVFTVNLELTSFNLELTSFFFFFSVGPGG
jgi:hypothetical protein